MEDYDSEQSQNELHRQKSKVNNQTTKSKITRERSLDDIESLLSKEGN